MGWWETWYHSVLVHAFKACMCLCSARNQFFSHTSFVCFSCRELHLTCMYTNRVLETDNIFISQKLIHTHRSLSLSLSLSLSSYTPQVMAWVLPLQQRRIPKTRSRLTKMPSCWSGPLQSPHLLSCSSVPVLIGSHPPMLVHATPCCIANICSVEEAKFSIYIMHFYLKKCLLRLHVLLYP